MEFFKQIFESITIKTFGDKIGFLFNNSMLNVTTSSVGVAFSSANCARSFVKGVIAPLPLCKVLYFTSSTLSGVSTISSALCLASGCSCIGPIPIGAAAFAYGTSVGARCCNTLSDCMNPAASLTTITTNACIDTATKNWS